MAHFEPRIKRTCAVVHFLYSDAALTAMISTFSILFLHFFIRKGLIFRSLRFTHIKISLEIPVDCNVLRPPWLYSEKPARWQTSRTIVFWPYVESNNGNASRLSKSFLRAFSLFWCLKNGIFNRKSIAILLLKCIFIWMTNLHHQMCCHLQCLLILIYLRHLVCAFVLHSFVVL